MARKFEGAPDMGGDALPVFYAIRRRGSIVNYVGARFNDGNSALLLFETEPEALQYMSDCCQHMEPPVEVVGSDAVGGVLALLGYASKDHNLVVLDPPQKREMNVDGASTPDPDIKLVAMGMITFIRHLGLLAS
jgi:hypothetical protein